MFILRQQKCSIPYIIIYILHECKPCIKWEFAVSSYIIIFLYQIDPGDSLFHE